MIARIWEGKVPRDRSEPYLEYLKQTGLQDYRETSGNRGVIVLARDEDDVTQFMLVTFWSSLAAIQEFAGEDVERARYYPQDEDFLLELRPTVDHFRVLVAEWSGRQTGE